MPAYMTPIIEQCGEPGCSKDATHEVRNGHNELMRKMCKKHAKMFVDYLNDENR
jgi:hypothetical protein